MLGSHPGLLDEQYVFMFRNSIILQLCLDRRVCWLAPASGLTRLHCNHFPRTFQCILLTFVCDTRLDHGNSNCASHIYWCDFLQCTWQSWIFINSHTTGINEYQLISIHLPPRYKQCCYSLSQSLLRDSYLMFVGILYLTVPAQKIKMFQ